MIVLRDVHFFYRDRHILKGVSFEVPAGQTIAVLGGSGSGKTTVLRLLLGFAKPDAGEILVNGQDIVSMTEHQLIDVRRRMGVVFQLGALFDSLAVGDNIAFPLRELRTMAEAEVIQRVEELIETVGLDPTVIDKMPSELSGGMNRRVAIARAIACRPQIILYDEPTTGLDPLACQVVCDLVIRLRDDYQVTSVFVTHQLAAAFRVATQFVLLRDGEILFDGSADELRRSTDPYITQFVNWEIGGLLDGSEKNGYLERLEGRVAGRQ